MPNYFSILPVISAVLCISLGLFTLSRNPRSLSNLGFMVGMSCLSIIEIGHAILLLAAADRQMVLLGMRTALAGHAILPVGWFFFSVVFARADYKAILSRWAAVLAGMTVVSATFAFLALSRNFTSLVSPEIINFERVLNAGQTPLFVIAPIGKYLYIYLIIAQALNLVHLENTLRSSSGTKRWQIKHVIFGVGAILAFFIYLYSQALLFSTVSIRTIPVTSAVILISSSLMGFFIVRHRLMDVDIFVSRYFVYNSVTILIIGLYLLITGLIAEGIKYFGFPLPGFYTTLFVFLSLLALVAMLFTTALRRKIKLFINRNFYKHKYEFRDKWMETIEKICSKGSIEETHDTLTGLVSETMGAKDIYLWLYNSLHNHYALVHGGDMAKYNRIKESHPIIRLIKEKMGPFFIDPATWNTGDLPLKELFEMTGAVVCAPLAAGRDIVGFMLQGKDLSGQPYGNDDLELLTAVTTQAAVQIKKIWFAEELTAVKEVEAFNKLSSFIIHDLKNLTNSLSLISQNAKVNMDNPEFQKDALRTVEHTVGRMKGLIHRLSSVNRSLDLKKKRAHIKSVVESAMKRMAMNNGKRVSIANETAGVPPITIDAEAMEMIFLNLLTNAYDAIDKEGVIRVRASSDGGHLFITFSDNGIGISGEFIENGLFHPFKTTKKGGFGIGLCQCKAIIEAHGGNIMVESKEGQGTTFTVKLPIE